METYRLNSRLVENSREYLIQTSNDAALGGICSEVFVNGTLADSVRLPHPEHLASEQLLALVKSTHGDKKKEVEALLKAYRQAMDSGSAEMLYHLGLAFYHKRFFAEARDLLSSAVTLNGRYHEAYNMLGQAELAVGNYDDAVAAGRTAVELRPEFADYRNNCGEAFMAARLVERAQEQFQKAIDINLYYSDAYFNFGLAVIMDALDEKNRQVLPNLTTRAVDCLNKACLTSPEYKTAMFEKGLKALKAGDPRQAFGLLKKVREEKKNQQARKYAPYHMQYAMHPLWITEQAVVDRIKFLETEIVGNPTYVDLHVELSRCYLEQARIIWKKGVDSYKKTLDLNPTLGNSASCVDQAEEVYEQINQLLSETDQRS